VQEPMVAGAVGGALARPGRAPRCRDPQGDALTAARADTLVPGDEPHGARAVPRSVAGPRHAVVGSRRALPARPPSRRAAGTRLGEQDSLQPGARLLPQLHARRDHGVPAPAGTAARAGGRRQALVGALRREPRRRTDVDGSVVPSRQVGRLARRDPARHRRGAARGRVHRRAVGDGLIAALPLEGLRVLDLSRVLAGPYATQLLGDLGAEVWKIERPGDGDETRAWGPPFVHGVSAYYLSVNRNKRSAALDFADPRHRGALLAAAAQCDVVVENFLPGALAPFGL